MKDVPAEQPPGLCIAAVPLREDARDAFISQTFASFDALPPGARLGTASLRRQAQALALRPDLRIEMLRGNVDTRLRRLADGDFDAILLATAGLNRLGFDSVIRERLSLDRFLPAPGQGALALQTRVDDVDTPWVAALDDPMSALAVAAERGAMTALEGSCRTAVGAHAVIAGEKLQLTAERLEPDGSAHWRRMGDLHDLAGTDRLSRAHALGLRLGSEVQAAAGDAEGGH
jgi:hydroxymethylbilane synthase